MDTCELFVRHDPKDPTNVTSGTKTILSFVLKNIDMINNRGHIVKIRLVNIKDEDQIEMLESKGISGIPAMLATNSKGPIKGPENIMGYLSRKASKSRHQEQEGEADEATHDFQLEVLEEGDEEENKDQDGARINARVAAEAARRGLNGGTEKSKKPKTADEAIEENRRRKAARSKPAKKKVQFKADPDDDDDQPGGDAQMKADDKRMKKRDEKEYNLELTPAEISRSIPATSGEDKRDQDLADKFWAGRFTSTSL